MTYFLAIDQGTSSTRVILYSQEGKVLNKSQYAIKQYYPQPGWVEHDPEEIWQKTLNALTDIINQVDIKISACGITNQRETTLIWDKESGRCLYPAIVWQDRRTQSFCDSLSNEAELIHAKTGLFPDAYFSASKLHWLLNNIPEANHLAMQGQLAFGTVDTFLLWRLTKNKKWLTDVTNASRTLLFNIFTQQWDEELVQYFKLSASLLAEVCASDAEFGVIDPSYFGTGIPITAMAGDQHAALIGQRCIHQGMVKATFGTGAFLLMNTEENPVISNHKLLTTIAYQVKGKICYGLEGSLYQAGTVVKWLRDALHLFKNASDSEHLAASLSSNDGVYLIPSFTGLGAPHWLNIPGAIISGLTPTSTRAHLARAALESICYQTREILACMHQDSGIDLTMLRADGGMTVNQWFLQFLSSQCGLIVQTPTDIETTAQGVAMLAAIGCGFYNSLAAIESTWQSQQVFYPEKTEAVEAAYQGWLAAMSMVKK